MDDDLQNSFSKKQDSFFCFGVTNNTEADYALEERSDVVVSIF